MKVLVKLFENNNMPQSLAYLILGELQYLLT